MIKSSTEWRRWLLRGRNVHGIFKRLGRINSLEFLVSEEPCHDGLNLNGCFLIDRRVFGERYTVNLGALAASVHKSDSFTLLTCSCGQPECAGITEDSLVVHEGDLTLWRAKLPKLRSDFVFNAADYRRTVMEGLDRIAHLVEFSTEMLRLLPEGLTDQRFLQIHRDTRDTLLRFKNTP